MDTRKDTRRSQKGTGEKVGLEYLAENAPDPRMKFLARAALRFGLTQRELGRRYALHKKVAWSSSGMVQTHFLAAHPKTVTTYADILGFSKEALDLAAGKLMDEKAARHWEREVLETLAISEADFKPETIDVVKRALQDSETRQEALRAYAMSSKNWLRASAAWSKLHEPLAAFAEKLYPRLDLRDFIQKVPSDHAALWWIYTTATKLYGNESKAETLVDVVDAIFRLDGFDTQPMRNFLKAQIESLDVAVMRHGRLASGKD